ncbi:hypothetical protein [Candidatus Nitrosocosmicus franklandus]|uniref:Uncharacterized protein n=1 Tax=Candidatus Nitrosocosmicus franklandianus TaxID=1798806 RepID=A0A484IB46_9ARCH|nr:hypothetical protein [Candidatus Nitrosocosmicus franklandus]VFJ14515.1 protein of unknown function [Candidatus Nitrosocosmicus franklandus]
MSRNKGDKDYTKTEKEILISMINDYQMFRFTDVEIMDLLSQKLGKKIGNTTFYRLKKVANKRKISSVQWLDNFVKFGLLDFYKERLEEMILVQNLLIKEYLKEAHKKDDVNKDKYQNKLLMNQLAKTISDNSKIMSEIAVGPATMAKLLSIIPKQLLEGDISCVENHFKNMDKEERILWPGGSSENQALDNPEKVDPSKAPTAILPAIEVPVNSKSDKDSNLDEEATAQGDQPIF